MFRLSRIYHYFGFWTVDELAIIERQKQLRHQMHRQICFSNLILKPTKTVVKTGIDELDKKEIKEELTNSQILKLHSKIIIPNDNFKKKKKFICKNYFISGLTLIFFYYLLSAINKQIK